MLSTYHSHWFCVLKQDGKSLHLIHNLQPLNAVTIWDSSTPPFVKHLVESFSGYVVYGMMDLFTRYDRWPLHLESQDLTTFNSLMDPYRLTIVPMGYTNVVQIYQADICFILQEEIPHHTILFIDNVAIKMLLTWYILPNGHYETIPENLGIWRFIWEHLHVINHILQWFENVGITVSTKKFAFAMPEVMIVRHKCTWEDWIPHEKKVQMIHDWPEYQNLTQVCRFLGVCGVLRIFIKGFTSITCLLVNLTWKGVSFEWEEPQRWAMQYLKDTICNSSMIYWNNQTHSRAGAEGISVIWGAFSSISDGMVSTGTWRVSQAGASSWKWSMLASAVIIKSGTAIPPVSNQVRFCCCASHSSVFHPSRLGFSGLRFLSLKAAISSHSGISFQPWMVSVSSFTACSSSSHVSSQDVQCLVGSISKVKRGIQSLPRGSI